MHKTTFNILPRFLGVAIVWSLWTLNDVYVRQQYQNAILTASEHIILYVREGIVSPDKGAKIAHQIRNSLVKSMRVKSAPGGRIIAILFKPKPRPVKYFLEKYAKKLFRGAAFESLTRIQANVVSIVLSFSSQARIR
jgi:hypothetical protein